MFILGICEKEGSLLNNKSRKRTEGGFSKITRFGGLVARGIEKGIHSHSGGEGAGGG